MGRALVLSLSDMGALAGCGAEECQDLTHIFKGLLRLVVWRARVGAGRPELCSEAAVEAPRVPDS